MKTPILDQIEFQMDNGIILLVAAIAVIAILVWVVNTLINILVNKRVSIKLNKHKAVQQHKIHRQAVVDNFFRNNIDTDIDNMYVTGTPTSSVLSKELVNLYND